jgi:predicted molibdopterin-dependent oxidoreductase YjgC
MSGQSCRITEHAILGAETNSDFVEVFFEGRPLKAKKGEPVMAALLAAGVSVFRHTVKGSPRRMFCGIGRCTDCIMIVDGIPGVRTCITRVREGMTIERQQGMGKWKAPPKTEGGA